MSEFEGKAENICSHRVLFSLTRSGSREKPLSLDVLISVAKKYRATALGWADFFGREDFSEPIREKGGVE